MLELPTSPNLPITRVVGDKAIALQSYMESRLNHTIDQQHSRVLETTPEQRQLELLAREFISRSTGLCPDSDIFWLPDDNKNKWATAYHVAQYNSIYIVSRTILGERDDYKEMREIATLVHELAHSTVANKNVRAIVSDGNKVRIEDDDGMTTHRFNRGWEESEHNSTPILGDFFDEAFAEETAAQWRKGFFPKVSGDPRISFSTGSARLPAKYFNINWRSGSLDYQTHANNPAYAAYAIDMLSNASGIDLYELIRQTRIPGQLASAKRDFIRAINSIDNTLYRDLRDLPYTADDFLKGLVRVQGIVDAKTSQPNK